MKKHSYNCNDRISGKKNISRLFTSGKFFFGKNIQAVVGFTNIEKGEKIQTGISVPKKNISKAVDRNFIKRRIKESVRLQKNTFSGELNIEENTLQIFFIWKSKNKIGFNEIFLEVELLMYKIQSKINEIPKI